MAFVDRRGLDQSRLNEPAEVHLRADSALETPQPFKAAVSRATNVPSAAVQTKRSDRVSTLKLGGDAPKLPRVAPFTGVGSRATAVDKVIRQTY